MDWLSTVHEINSWIVIIGNGLAGAWALAAFRYTHLRSRSLWRLTLVAELAIGVQAILGVAMIEGESDALRLHMFYGFVAIISAALLYSCKQQLGHRVYLLYGFGGLFIMGLGIRALVVINR